MSADVEFFVVAACIGIGATATMDLWALIQQRFLGIKGLDYAMVGRWLGHLPRRKVVHPSGIAQSPRVIGERPLGWAAHYFIGILFSLILLIVMGRKWAYAPTLGPALLTGWLSLIAPFLVLQPCMGAGIAGSLTPKPNVVRWRSFVAHTSFGIGIYLSASMIAAIFPLPE